MVSFELGKEIENDAFRLVTSVGQKKKLSSHEELKLSLGAPMLHHWATETIWWGRLTTKFMYDTHPAYC